MPEREEMLRWLTQNVSFSSLELRTIAQAEAEEEKRLLEEERRSEWIRTMSTPVPGGASLRFDAQTRVRFAPDRHFSELQTAFRRPQAEVTPLSPITFTRSMSKTLSFAAMYGMSPASFRSRYEIGVKAHELLEKSLTARPLPEDLLVDPSAEITSIYAKYTKRIRFCRRPTWYERINRSGG